MQITNMKLSDIRPYERNPRFNDEAVEAVAKSIKEFGFNSRVMSAKEMKTRYPTGWIACGQAEQR